MHYPWACIERLTEWGSDMSDTAKIVRFHELGRAGVLRIEDLPLPQPGHGEVRLRVRAFGLNRAECSFRMGKYLVQPTLPSKLGYEASGIVEAVGDGVDRAWLGKTVSTVPAFPADQYGVYGEVAIVPERALAEYPARLSYEEGTSIWMQYLTAYGALVLQGKVAKGDFVVITAASSSVGVAAIEMVKAEGAISIATTRTSAKRAELSTLGADYVIATQEEDLAARVMEITGGKGARLVFDAIGGRGINALAACTALGGIIFQYGAIAMEPTPFPMFAALKRHLWFKGYTLFEVTNDPANFEKAKKYVFDRLQSGVFTPKIAKVFSLSEVVQAQEYMESNAQVGKIVVRV
jgi:NADPH:quinone reductase-like Zn-dependent oxidoreductase